MALVFWDQKDVFSKNIFWMSKEMFSGHFFLTSDWRKKCRLWFETRIISKKTLKKNLKIIWSYLELSGIKWNYIELSGIIWNSLEKS